MENSDIGTREKESSNNDFVFSTAQTCNFFSVTRETLSAWSKQGCPKNKRGYWNIKDVMDWLGKGNSASKKDISDEARKLKADADYREMKAEKESISLAVLRSEYISKEEVDRQWSVVGNQLKSNMLLWSRTLGPELAHLDMRSAEKVLTDAVYDLLDQISSTGQYRKRKKK